MDSAQTGIQPEQNNKNSEAIRIDETQINELRPANNGLVGVLAERSATKLRKILAVHQEIAKSHIELRAPVTELRPTTPAEKRHSRRQYKKREQLHEFGARKVNRYQQYGDAANISEHEENGINLSKPEIRYAKSSFKRFTKQESAETKIKNQMNKSAAGEDRRGKRLKRKIERRERLIQRRG